MSWLKERLNCLAMDKAFRFLLTADAERIAQVANEITLRCQNDTERAAVCGTLNQVLARIRPKRRAEDLTEGEEPGRRGRGVRIH